MQSLSSPQLATLLLVTSSLQATDARHYRDALEARMAGPWPNLISGGESRAMASLRRYCMCRIDARRELRRRATS